MISEITNNYIVSNNKIKISVNLEQEENLIEFNKQDKILTQNGDNKRAKFQPNEQKAIIDVYDKYTDKAIAMRMLKNIPGLENMYERKIKRWKSTVDAVQIPNNWDPEVGWVLNFSQKNNCSRNQNNS